MKRVIEIMLKRSIVSALLIGFSAGVVANEQTRIGPKADPSENMELRQKRNEMKRLENLPEGKLRVKVSEGDPLAGLALAQQLSREAQGLSKLPTLANSAAEDAARWYSLAARMGALQSQSLSGISLSPLRATRGKRR